MSGNDFGSKTHIRITLLLNSDVMNKAIEIFDNYITLVK